MVILQASIGKGRGVGGAQIPPAPAEDTALTMLYMVKFHHFDSLEYLLYRCGVVFVHSGVGMCKCICIYI